VLTFYFLTSLNFVTVCVKLNPHETVSTISGGYDNFLIPVVLVEGVITSLPKY